MALYPDDYPQRAERLWLALALATWWVLAVGGEAEAHLPDATFPTVPSSPRQQGRRWRLVGIALSNLSLPVPVSETRKNLHL